METKIEFHDYNYVIARNDAPFGTGWNVYQKMDEDKESEAVSFKKINEPLTCFKSFEAAEAWLDEYRISFKKSI